MLTSEPVPFLLSKLDKFTCGCAMPRSVFRICMVGIAIAAALTALVLLCAAWWQQQWHSLETCT